MCWRGGVCAIGGSLLFFLACGSSYNPANHTEGDSSVPSGGSGGDFESEPGGSTSRSGSGSASPAASGDSTEGLSGAAGTPTTGDAGSGGSSGESGSAGAAGQDQGRPTFAGAIYVGIDADSGGILLSSASAHFALPIEQPNCTTQTFGDCNLTNCDDTLANSWTKADAGPITVNFADQFSEELYPTDQGLYADYWGQQVVSPGDAISVTAVGDEIPAFSSSIVQPEPLRLISPGTDAYGQLAVRADADLELTFTGGTAGVRLGAESRASYSGGSFVIRCSFASQAGRALIPKSLLQYSAGFWSLYTYRARSVPAGDYAIDLEGRSVVFNAEGLRVYIEAH